MTEVFMTLLTELCKINPERFRQNEYHFESGPSLRDDCQERIVHEWRFHDKHYNCTLTRGDLEFANWLFEMLNELDLAEIWKQEGRTWEESILNAIVHRMEVKE